MEILSNQSCSLFSKPSFQTRELWCLTRLALAFPPKQSKGKQRSRLILMKGSTWFCLLSMTWCFKLSFSVKCVSEVLGLLEGAGRCQEPCSVCFLLRHSWILPPVQAQCPGSSCWECSEQVSVEAEMQKSTADPNKQMMSVQWTWLRIH